MFKGYFEIDPTVGLFNSFEIGMSGVTRGLKLTIDRSLNGMQLHLKYVCSRSFIDVVPSFHAYGYFLTHSNSATTRSVLASHSEGDSDGCHPNCPSTIEVCAVSGRRQGWSWVPIFTPWCVALMWCPGLVSVWAGDQTGQHMPLPPLTQARLHHDIHTHCQSEFLILCWNRKIY